MRGDDLHSIDTDRKLLIDDHAGKDTRRETGGVGQEIDRVIQTSMICPIAKSQIRTSVKPIPAESAF
jgi:hypothetical protein